MFTSNVIMYSLSRHVRDWFMSLSMSIKNFSVAKIAKLLHRPRGHGVVKGQCRLLGVTAYSVHCNL